MSSGLNALTQVETNLATAVAAAVTELGVLVGEISNSEDEQVQAAAEKMQTLIDGLNQAVTAAQTPPATTDPAPSGDAASKPATT